MLKIIEKKIGSENVTKLKKYWLTIAFLLGFVVDNITLNRVDQVFDNLVLLFYVLLAMFSLAYLYAGLAEKLPQNWIPGAKKYSPLLIQYAFGGLLSGMLIFYGRSGDWTQTWPFMLIILAVIYGNETITNRSTRMVFNLAIFFVGLFSYLVLVIPVLTGLMGPWVFVGSGLLALVVMHFYLKLLHFIIPRFIELKKKLIIFVIGTLFAVLNFLYFANIIPPIPLSLKDVGIYHSVVRFENGDYQLKYEAGKWWEPFKNSDNVYHPTQSSDIFCFAKVFAPTRLETQIFHKWQFYDEEAGAWKDHSRLSYQISGGRGNGFRGYTLVENFQDGKWRCVVETARGQKLGREVFWVDSTQEPEELVTRIE